VRAHAARGVDLIKIMATGGNMTPSLGPHESQFTAIELSAAVQTAHAHGLKIAAHAHGGQDIADAMAAGVDSIEHCTFFTAEGVDADPDVIAELGRQHTVVSVTGGAIPGSTTPYPAIAKRLAATQANHAALQTAAAAGGGGRAHASSAGPTPASDRTSRTTSSATESVLCPPSE
jgi:imidazolonepropionase-like amidohydrolase